jgi:putative restriction endonuclease
MSNIPLGDHDAQLRAAIFAQLAEWTMMHGDVLPRDLFLQGIQFMGLQVRLIDTGGKGIWKPSGMDKPISVYSSHRSPYDDHFEGSLLQYSYQGTDPNLATNRSLREAMRTQTPLLYIHAVVPKQYLPVWPVFVVADDPSRLRFTLQAEVGSLEIGGASITSSLGGESFVGEDARREYGTQLLKTRLHQRGFRERVLAAYQTHCAMCHLRHRELLDAAHILADADGGKPVVSNGLSLCKIHHAAFDARVIGIRPEDYRVVVREDILEEVDGPMLRHGIQELEGSQLWIPRLKKDRPNQDLLAERFERFLEAG